MIHRGRFEPVVCSSKLLNVWISFSKCIGFHQTDFCEDWHLPRHGVSMPATWHKAGPLFQSEVERVARIWTGCCWPAAQHPALPFTLLRVTQAETQSKPNIIIIKIKHLLVMYKFECLYQANEFCVRIFGYSVYSVMLKRRRFDNTSQFLLSSVVMFLHHRFSMLYRGAMWTCLTSPTAFWWRRSAFGCGRCRRVLTKCSTQSALLVKSVLPTAANSMNKYSLMILSCWFIESVSKLYSLCRVSCI